MRATRGFTLVEVVFVAAVALPVLVMSLQALLVIRQAEASVVAMASAARGACLLEGQLRRDVESLDLAAGAEACRVVTGVSGVVEAMVFRVSRAGDGAATVKEELRYEFEAFDIGASSPAYRVKRGEGTARGRVMATVVVHSFVPRLWMVEGLLTLQVNLATLDPALRRRADGEHYRYETSILTALPWTPAPGALFDYTSPTP